MFPTRGPARYFGGDEALAMRVLDAVREVGIPDARIGVTDGAFAARLAACSAPAGEAWVVAPGETPAFLEPWPVGVLAPVVENGADLTDLLVRLGLSTLGAFAGLTPSAVLARFGIDGARVHCLARGLDEHRAPPQPVAPDLVECCELDPPAARVDEAAFAAKTIADRLLARLATLGLSCMQVIVEAETEHGERLTRCWRHEGALTPAALMARVRWQLEGWLTGGDSAADHPTAGLTLVRLVPDQVMAATGRQLGFWADAAADDRADRAFARVQSVVGQAAVATAVPTGGRLPHERVRWVPWGEPRDEDAVDHDATWPGAIPGPAPARVHEPPLAARLLDERGEAIAVSGRGEPSAAPARLESEGLPAGAGRVIAWAGPWPQDVRWWDRAHRRRIACLQLVVDTGVTEVACLVTVESGAAFLTAIYD